MSYRIYVTRSARADMLQAWRYISGILQNRKAADDLMDKVSGSIRSLSEYHDRYSLIRDPVLRSWGIRSIRIDNYNIFYTVDTGRNMVLIVRFLYFRRSWSSVLITEDEFSEHDQ